MWYDSLIRSPESYEEFVKCFRQQFWSIDIQRRVYDDVVRPYQYRSPIGLATHAIMWITKAKYLDPPINQMSLVSTIIQNYPSSLAIAIRGRGPKTTSELISVLTEFENTVSFWDEPSLEQYQNNGRLNIQHQNNQRQNNQPFYNQMCRKTHRVSSVMTLPVVDPTNSCQAAEISVPVISTLR